MNSANSPILKYRTRWMACLVFVFASLMPAQGATRTHAYLLSGTYTDEMGGTPLIPNGGSLTATGYNFSGGQGLSLTNAVRSADYSIELLFFITDTVGYGKLLDFKDRSTDDGLYNNDGALGFYPEIQSTDIVFRTNQAVHMVLTRDGPTERVTAYVNGTNHFTFIDSLQYAVFSAPGNVIQFFQDDFTTGGAENPRGFVDRIQLFDGALSSSEVLALFQNPPAVVLTSPTNNAFFFMPPNLTLMANASDSDGTVVKVEFFADGTKLGESTNSPFSFVWADPPIGSHVLHAVATDNQGAVATSEQSAVAIFDTMGTPLAQIVSPTNGVVMEGPTNLTVSAWANAVNGVTNVQFLANGFVIGNDTSNPYSINWNAPFGSNGLTVVTFDGQDNRATSALVSVTITIPSANTAPPTIAARNPVANATLTNLTSIQVTFSERIVGVERTDLLVNGAPATHVSGSGSNYTFTFTQPPYGIVPITWASGHGITDIGYPSSLPFDETALGATWNYNLIAPSVEINAAPTSRLVDARHFGLNAAVWDSQFEEPANLALLRHISAGAYRFPGGSLSDEYHWAVNRSGNNAFTWANSFTDFSRVVTNLGVQAIITVNYGTGTPGEAAAWVRHANVTNRYGFKYWEIGNECYGIWETDSNNLPHHAYTYATRAAAYFTQMKAADPSIKIGVPVVASEALYSNGYSDHPVVNPRTGATRNGWTPVMLVRLANLGVVPDFLVYHRYPQGPGTESDAGLLRSNNSWATDAATLRQILSDYLGAASASVELLCTENNSVFSSPGKQSTSLVNGLFLADSIASAMQTEFNAVIWWDLRNGTSANNNNSSALYGWRLYGDYGIVNGYDRFPTSYVLELLQYFARGGDALSTATSSDSLLAATAVRRTNGTLTILTINKDSTLTRTANFTLKNFAPRGDVVLRSYGIPQDDAARTGVGSREIAGSTFSIASTNFARSFAPYSVSVLTVYPNGASNLPPSVALAAPVNGASVAANQATLSAAVSDPDSLVTLVEFFVAGQAIGQTTNEPHTLIWSNAAPGTYTIGARATDHLGLSATSSLVNIAIVPAPITLLATGSVWRYLDTGGNLGTSWRGLGFPDNSWPSGPAQLGFGDGDEATVIASNRQWTTYFRRTFEVPANLIATDLLLRLLRDDGAVVHINSNEVWRSNMPATGAILYNTPASAGVPAADETSNLYITNVTGSFLVPGTNIVAVEVHQNAINSSDLSFDFELLAFTTSPPRLTASMVVLPAGPRVRIAWPAVSATFVLQRSSGLTTGWTNMSAGSSEGTERVFYDTLNVGSYFYRLRKP